VAAQATPDADRSLTRAAGGETRRGDRRVAFCPARREPFLHAGLRRNRSRLQPVPVENGTSRSASPRVAIADCGWVKPSSCRGTMSPPGRAGCGMGAGHGGSLGRTSLQTGPSHLARDQRGIARRPAVVHARTDNRRWPFAGCFQLWDTRWDTVARRAGLRDTGLSARSGSREGIRGTGPAGLEPATPGFGDRCSAS
jgi:hypothetical protein